MSEDNNHSYGGYGGRSGGEDLSSAPSRPSYEPPASTPRPSSAADLKKEIKRLEELLPLVEKKADLEKRLRDIQNPPKP